MENHKILFGEGEFVRDERRGRFRVD